MHPRDVLLGAQGAAGLLLATLAGEAVGNGAVDAQTRVDRVIPLRTQTRLDPRAASGRTTRYPGSDGAFIRRIDTALSTVHGRRLVRGFRGFAYL